MPSRDLACDELKARALDAALEWCPRSSDDEGDSIIASKHDRADCLFASYDVLKTAYTLHSRGFQRVALQFPDSLLPDSFFVYAALDEALRVLVGGDDSAEAPIVFILGDTSYGECCVDEVAAQHLDADIVVHYGNACLSPTRALPVLYVFHSSFVSESHYSSRDLLKHAREALSMAPDAKRLVVLFDVELHGVVDDIAGAWGSEEGISVADEKSVAYSRTRVDVSSIVEPAGDSSNLGPGAMRCGTSCCSTGDKTSGTEGATRRDGSVRENPGAETSISKGMKECSVDGVQAGSEKAGRALEVDGGASGWSICGPLSFQSTSISETEVPEAETAEMHTAFLWLTCRSSGEESIQLRNAGLQYSATKCAGFFSCCIASDTSYGDGSGHVERVDMSRLLARRFAIVDKVRDAERVGIIAGTLGVSGNLAIIERCKRVVERAGRRWYMVMVGKPSAAKLGNFPEMDVFVLVACPQNSLIDSRDHLRPVVTPFELEVALGDRDWFSDSYSADFTSMLRLPPIEGEAGRAEEEELAGGEDGDLEDPLQVVERGEWKVLAGSTGGAAEFLRSRDWQGLDPERNADGVVVGELDTHASEGRPGVATGYEGEGDGE